ncbi:DUF5677 domain-containing protein [Alteriqipengyuania sp. WL0013]|uniref:DUF5677 domain-containing protein n=1 Tax=Alteriqipengyuania sp. WL0013 TaxID=3110773 RepID=UPI002CAC8556|nr:DUF5677 domain-containing protein [Alteriqipengyuania sp. WL0013]MEB3414628.1 DUF5677 domain-containing protein [Alteriqipengyuania sp. WL0013]
MTSSSEAVATFARSICQNATDNLFERTDNFRFGDGFETTTNSVFSALLARQTSLSLGLAESPFTWSGHIAPLILRSMIDLLITYRWIALEPQSRAAEYVNYGLGSEKLLTAHYQSALEEGGEDESVRRIAEANLAWIEGQQFQMFVEVNLGSWTGKSIRQMCVETGDEDLYKFSYTPFSAAVHNMWNHVGKWNAKTCTNPMHKQHSIGVIHEAWPIVDFVFRACKYLDLTLQEFDHFYEYEGKAISPTDCFNEHIEALSDAWNGDETHNDVS